MAGATILVVDDEQLIRWALAEELKGAGYQVLVAENGKAALERAREGADLILLDYKLPDGDGIGLLPKFKEAAPDAPIIMLTAVASVDVAVTAMRAGAWHYLNKPVNTQELLLLIGKALETRRLKSEVTTLRKAQSRACSIDAMIGESPVMRALKAMLAKIAASPASTVMLTGESGTGKDLAAKCIHHAGSRAAAPFMNITCSALPEHLLESELFGHEKGAFTGAERQKRGLLEVASGGTVFLDEIGEMSLPLQAKLLRFLEERAFKRVGGSADVKPDVRVIAATHRNLRERVKDGAFREDLFYRLDVLPVTIPPLRERRGDIPLLVRYYIAEFNGEFKKNVRDIAAEALDALEAHSWPGNVRELRNTVERAVLLAEGLALGRDSFLNLTPRQDMRGFNLPPAGIDFDDLERSLLVQALERTSGNQTQAAKLLGMNRDQIRYRIEKFEIGRLQP